jgi:hypothetical protein
VTHVYNPSYSGGREIRRIVVQSQPGQIIYETVSKNPITKKDWWSGQGIAPEVNLQYHNNTKQNKYTRDLLLICMDSTSYSIHRTNLIFM